MQSYREQVEALREQLNKARHALASDVAAAVSGTDWPKFLRDRYDVAALVEQIDGLAAKPEWVTKLQAAGDRLRQQGRQRGRPRKQQKPSNGRAAPTSKPGEVMAETVA